MCRQVSWLTARTLVSSLPGVDPSGPASGVKWRKLAAYSCGGSPGLRSHPIRTVFPFSPARDLPHWNRHGRKGPDRCHGVKRGKKGVAQKHIQPPESAARSRSIAGPRQIKSAAPTAASPKKAAHTQPRTPGGRTGKASVDFVALGLMLFSRLQIGSLHFAAQGLPGSANAPAPQTRQAPPKSTTSHRTT